MHLAFSNGHFLLGKYLIEKGANQDFLTNDGLDWKAFADKAGQDVEAIDAALKLDLQVFDAPKIIFMFQDFKRSTV